MVKSQPKGVERLAGKARYGRPAIRAAALERVSTSRFPLRRGTA